MLLAIMETVYVMTGRDIWREMVKYWGVLFGINFVLGVATGITMEFQFGTNWAYYSHYVGDVFGVPLHRRHSWLFFRSDFCWVFFFGWDRLSQVATYVLHLVGGFRNQSFSIMDFNCQWLDAKSCWC